MNNKTCTIQNCSKPSYWDGLCSKHYKLSPKKAKVANSATVRFCTMPDCNRKYLAKGLCQYHYDQATRGRRDSQPSISIHKPHTISFRCTTEERERLKAYAKYTGQTATDVLASKLKELPVPPVVTEGVAA
jgi:hypothetical protein